MDGNLIQFLSGLLVTIVSAATAAYFGVAFGIRKVKRERAFDRRLAWYEDAVAKLARAHAAIRGMQNRLSNVPLLGRSLEEDVQELLASLYDFPTVLSGARLYAASDTVSALSKAADDIVIVAKLTGSLMELDGLVKDWPARPAVEKHLQILGSLFQHAVARLTRDIRKHLGLDELPTSGGIYSVQHEAVDAMRKRLRDQLGELEGLLNEIDVNEKQPMKATTKGHRGH